MNGLSSRSTMVPVFSMDDIVPIVNTVGMIVGGPAGAALQTVGDLTADQLKAVMPAARAANIARCLSPINQAFRSYGISQPEQRAAFLAHVHVECKQLNAIVEDLWYNAPRIMAVWPSRFKTLKDAKLYEHDPEKLANHVYCNRLDNGDEASGDGYRFRGRGLLQVTGRVNYRAQGLEDNPEALEDPNTAADSAARHWKSAGLNEQTTKVLTRAQFNSTTQTLNGGQTGAPERWAAYQLALKALLPQPARPALPRRR